MFVSLCLDALNSAQEPSQALRNFGGFGPNWTGFFPSVMARGSFCIAFGQVFRRWGLPMPAENNIPRLLISQYGKNFWRLKKISQKVPTAVPRSNGQQCLGKHSSPQERLRIKILPVPGPILASPNGCPGMRTALELSGTPCLVLIQRKKQLLLRGRGTTFKLQSLRLFNWLCPTGCSS